MFKRVSVLIAVVAASLAAPLTAAPVVSLPGVSDRETNILGSVAQYVMGKGDVMFVRDQFNRWYRVALTPGCLSAIWSQDVVQFEGDRAIGMIDTFSHVHFLRNGRTCGVDSIRRSLAPPQVNSRSPVTLD